MKTISVNLYNYDELSDKAKERARNWFADATSGDEWWEGTYEDAAQIGLKITGFDCGRGNDIKGELTKSMLDVIDLIIKNHGESCESYKLAQSYRQKLSEYLENTLDDDYPDKEDEFVEAHEDEFTKELCEEYLIMLRKELEYVQSQEVIEENIRANEYTFLKSGERFN